MHKILNQKRNQWHFKEDEIFRDAATLRGLLPVYGITSFSEKRSLYIHLFLLSKQHFCNKFTAFTNQFKDKYNKKKKTVIKR